MIKKLLFGHDWVITAVTALLIIIGIATIFSTSVGGSMDEFQKQLLFFVVGIFIYFGLSFLDYSYFKYKPVVFLLYGITIILLILGYIAGHNVNGATRWLRLGFLNIQPSEIAKVTIIISLASFFVTTAYSRMQSFLFSFAILFPIIILVFIEPSLSSSIILCIIWICMYFFYSKNEKQNIAACIAFFIGANIAGGYIMPKILFFPVIHSFSTGVLLISGILLALVMIQKSFSLKSLAIILLCGVVLGFSANHIIWAKVLKPYQKDRIMTFVNQGSANQSTVGGYQLIQSKIAIGSGELLGKGFAQGTQSKLNFLPEHNTDFIFASFSEEFGLFGDAVLIILFCILLFRILSIADSIQDPFAYLLIIGIIVMFVFQIFANIGINIGVLPSTGIPMPLVSYGGSSLWISLVSLGLIQSIYKQTKERKWINIDI